MRKLIGTIIIASGLIGVAGTTAAEAYPHRHYNHGHHRHWHDHHRYHRR